MDFSGKLIVSVITGMLLFTYSAPCHAGGWYEAYGIKSEYELYSPDSVRKIVVALGSSSNSVRINAIETLGKIGKPAASASSSIIQLLYDDNANIRLKSLLALESIGYKGKDFSTILDYMKENDKHKNVRANALRISSKMNESVSQQDVDKSIMNKPTTSSDLASIVPSISQQNKHAVAVIIGNKNYSQNKKNVPDVSYAHNDADLIYQLLTKSLGYREGNIILIKDAAQANLTATFGNENFNQGRLYDMVRPGVSDVFVYYSGHGAPSLRTGTGYLLPVDADPAMVELNGYALATLYKNINGLPAKSKTIIVDACFSGGSFDGGLVRNASSISLRLNDVPKPSADMTIISAAGISEVASWDEQTKHGLFTRYFIEGISGAADSESYGNNDGRVTIPELKTYLEGEVPYQARRLYGRDQTPQVQGGQDIFYAMWNNKIELDRAAKEAERLKAEELRRQQEAERLLNEELRRQQEAERLLAEQKRKEEDEKRRAYLGQEQYELQKLKEELEQSRERERKERVLRQREQQEVPREKKQNVFIPPTF